LQACGPPDGYDYGDDFVEDDDEDAASGGCNQEEDENTGKIKIDASPPIPACNAIQSHAYGTRSLAYAVRLLSRFHSRPIPLTPGSLSTTLDIPIL
jgi:hypothetical protein